MSQPFFKFMLWCAAISLLVCDLTANAQTTEYAHFSALSSHKNKELSLGNPIIKVKKIFNEDGKAAAISGDIIIKATPNQIWDVLTDCNRAPEFLPGLQSCEILDRDGNNNWDIRRHITKVSPFLPEVKSEFKNQYEPGSKILFSRTGGDLKYLNGYWEIKKVPDTQTTRLSYRSVLASSSILPDKVLRNSISKRMPKVLLAIRDEVKFQTRNTALTKQSNAKQK